MFYKKLGISSLADAFFASVSFFIHSVWLCHVSGLFSRFLVSDEVTTISSYNISLIFLSLLPPGDILND
jgi:hypothetical protein